jgi:predicted AlkP superfamily pyrophosphatase or phosphodiesterase
VIDQLGADELDRLEPVLTGGLRHLLERGVSFSDAHHAHALTETAPGHATLATGRHPRSHGIVTNWWLEQENPEKHWAVDDEEYEESPRQLLASTLGDWLKAYDPWSKSFAASGKDRAAITLAGRQADAAFWYQRETGRFRTSGYYGQPEWLASFNDRELAQGYLGEAWRPLPLSAEQIEQIGIEPLALGPLWTGFPHVIGRPRVAVDEDFYTALLDSPWQDSYLTEFARFLIAAEELGADGHPDLLALSYSAPDYVGHDYGPHSREYTDVVLRLDRRLRELLDSVEEQVGLAHTVIALSADHGVVPVPEVRQAAGLPGRRVDADLILCLQGAGRRLAEEYGVERWFLTGGKLAPELGERTGRTADELEDATARRLEECPGVAKVWSRGVLAEQGAAGDRERWLFANSYHPERSPDFLIQFEEFLMPSVSLVTTHGSPYAYDTRVPVVFLAPGLEAARHGQPIRTVDVAPTLAALAGVPYPSDLDGRDLALLGE